MHSFSTLFLYFYENFYLARTFYPESNSVYISEEEIAQQYWNDLHFEQAEKIFVSMLSTVCSYGTAETMRNQYGWRRSMMHPLYVSDVSFFL